MPGPQSNTPIQNDKTNAFMKKLELWKIDLYCNTFYMFPTIEACPPSNQREAKKRNFSC
jgi:hypothetical protein